MTRIFFSFTPHVLSTRIKKHSAQLSAMIGTNCLFARPWPPKLPTYAVNTNTTIIKKVVSTLTFELERRLNVQVDEVGLVIRYLYGYNSVCFSLKTSHSLTLPGRLKIVRISCCFENTRHLTQTKGRSLDETLLPPLKVWMRGCIAHAKHFT